MREITNGDDNEAAEQDGEEEDFAPRRRKAKADYRAQIEPAPTPELGFNMLLLDQATAAGPAGLRRAQRTALRCAKRYLEDASDSWKLETEWLKSFDTVHRARARYALVWRPRFLAALSMCHSPELAARHTRISCQMAYYHRKHDSQFAKQWHEAREYGVEMLNARAFQRALEQHDRDARAQERFQETVISTTSQATNSTRALVNVAACQLEENSLDSGLCIRQLLKADHVEPRRGTAARRVIPPRLRLMNLVLAAGECRSA